VQRRMGPGDRVIQPIQASEHLGAGGVDHPVGCGQVLRDGVRAHAGVDLADLGSSAAQRLSAGAEQAVTSLEEFADLAELPRHRVHTEPATGLRGDLSGLATGCGDPLLRLRQALRGPAQRGSDRIGLVAHSSPILPARRGSGPRLSRSTS
jgi:hypothetical protein